jgi:VCBS repeat-containing protein
MTKDGSLRVLKRGTLDTTPITKREHLAEQVREYQAKGYPIPERISRQLSARDLRRPAARPKGDAKTWSEADSVFAAAHDFSASPQAILTKGQISKNAAEDLIVLNSSTNRVLALPFVADAGKAENQTTFTGKREKIEYSVENQPIAALPMRLNADGETDLLVVGKNQADFAALVSAVAASFTVNSNLDIVDANLADNVCETAVPGQCTLRAAIMQANATPGNDSITIQSGIGAITINLGQPDNDGLGTNDEASGDLDITCVIDPGTFTCQEPAASNDNDLTITGAAGGSTVQAGIFIPYITDNGPITTDRVFDIGQSGVFGGGFGGSTGIIVSMSNLTIQNGNVRELTGDPNGGGNYALGGAIRYDGFGVSAAHGSLTLTNSTLNNNQSDHAGGGVYQVYGSFNAGGSTFSSNITKAGEGGGVFFSAATSNSNVSVTNSTFNANEARQGVVFGTPTTNADGGGLSFSTNLNTLTVTNTNFTNNIAQEDGGAIKTLNGMATLTGGSMTGNTARRHGGVSFGDQNPSGVGSFFTFDGSTLRGNTANSDNAAGGDGGAIFRDRGVLNITNTTIGGTGAGEPNTAANGGGIFNLNGVLSITGGSVNGNIANTGKGGGIEHSGRSASTVSSVTINNNTGSGIHISGTGSLDIANSTITGNSGDGITKIGTGVGSHFNSNTIHSNGELGIDLSDNAVTPNDANDADTGPNNLQNFPVINSVDGGNNTANVTLNAANGSYRIQYFANTACDVSGYGEGEVFLTSQTVTVSGNTATFTSPALSYGTKKQITATATHDQNGNGNFDDDGSTSEFSQCREAIIVNVPPTANPDSYSTNEDTLLTVAAPGVLQNDSDPDAGNTLTAVLVSGPTNAASFTLNSNGSFNYTPNANYNGADSFTYKARDNFNAESSPVTVSITVNPVNDAPSFTSGGNVTVAEDSGAYSAAWATAISKGAANESGQTLTFMVTNNTNPALFSVAPSIASNGVLSFTPAANAFGSATITVVLKDNGGTANGGQDTSAPVSFTITVTPVNDAPTVSVVAGGSCGNGGSNGTINLVINDPDSPPGNATLSGSSSNTTIVPNSNIVFGGSGANRTMTITPVPVNQSTQNSTITITVSDGQGGTSTTTVTAVVGGNGTQSVIGTSGEDMIFGFNGGDTLYGGEGKDLLCGGNGSDSLFGGEGDDTLDGDNGSDNLYGDGGNDILIGGGGGDFFSGGTGTDTATDFNLSEGDTTDGS